MRRRAFIAGLGSAVVWPLVAQAQGERVRRIGVLMNLTADDPEAAARFKALAQGLQQFGWIVGRNVQMITVTALSMPTAVADTRRNWSR